MPAETSEKDYTSRRGELSAFGRATNSSKFLRRLVTVLALLVSASLLLAVLLVDSNAARIALFVTGCVLIIGLFIIWRFTKAHFIDPDLAFRKWLQQVCDGELEAGIELPASHRHFKELDFHTRNLTSSLRHLSTDMEMLVDSQTRRLEKQNRMLELLFQLTSDVAGKLDLDAVLHAVCSHLSGWLDDADTAAYMLKADNLKLRAASGPNGYRFKSLHPAAELLSADSSRLDITKLQFSSTSDTTFGAVKKLQIPVFNNREFVGIVEIVAAADSDHNSKESQRVFQTVSEQLSVFVLKSTVLESAHNARLLSERTQLGADLHDSLAQTLLATGYKVKMLKDTLSSNTSVAEIGEVEHIEEMINEANAEVRNLIGEYRKPLSNHRYADSIKHTIDEFNQSSSIEVYFQLDSPGVLFTAREDSVIHRIVGEALNNAEKYSNATTIRVYVRMEASGSRSILVEDDGVGFSTSSVSHDGTSCDHIGLSIMRDRALSVGAMLTIDSEPGEGTRVFLKLPPLELSEGV